MIAVVLFDEADPPGSVAVALEERDLPWHLVDAAGELPPDPSAVVLLGGHHGAYEEARYPWLVGLKDWIRQVVGDGVPVLGLCLGAQLLADSLGGRAYLAPVPEVRFVEPAILAADPLADALAAPWVLCHQDTFDPPDGALVFAETAYPAAFRLGTAVGLQMHPEVDREIVGRWMARPGGPASWGGFDPAEVVAAIDPGYTDRGLRLIGAWLDQR